jgi:2-polyprenyl-3-methyl-5-hydroxy-6-metoxy-1,4-benzoquinol methylase
MRNSPARQSAGNPGNSAVFSVDGSSAAVTTDVAPDLRELETLLRESTDNLGSSNAVLLGRANASLRRHLDPARANLLRALNITDADFVLEVGAEAGALTRYLAETAGAVDALEADLSLASLAQLRTRDLDTVRVFAAEVTALPAEPTYSLILAVDLLRRTAPDNRATVLAHLQSLLLPGGTIVLAESNRLGTKYLMGSPDDVTGRVFDSIENYPHGTTSAAITHADLERILDDAGLRREYLPALPDHTFTRTVVRSSALPAELTSLSADLTLLPSPDQAGVRPKLADERLVWPQLVDNGLDIALSNSWMILLTRDEPSPLLDDTLLASFDGWQRAAQYTPHTQVTRDDSGRVSFNRVYPNRSGESPLLVENSVRPYLRGHTLLASMTDAPFDELGPIFEQWRAAVERTTQDRVWLDLHPGNFIVDGGGDPRPIDLEFASTSHDREFVLQRGLIFSARSLAMARPPESFPADIVLISDLALALGELLGFTRESGWFDAALKGEAALQHEVAGERGGSTTVEHRALDLRAQFDTPLANLPLGPRVFDQVGSMADERDQAHVRLGVFGDRIQVLERRESELEAIIEDQTAQLHERDRLLDVQRTDAAAARGLLTRHIASLENEIQTIRAAASAIEIALRNDIHHRYLENERLQALVVLHNSRAVQTALRLRRVAERALPGNSRRRALVGRVLGPVRRR